MKFKPDQNNFTYNFAKIYFYLNFNCGRFWPPENIQFNEMDWDDDDEEFLRVKRHRQLQLFSSKWSANGNCIECWVDLIKTLEIYFFVTLRDNMSHHKLFFFPLLSFVATFATITTSVTRESLKFASKTLSTAD